MNRNFLLICTTAALMSCGAVWAQDSDTEDEAEATIRLMGAAEAELPDAVTKQIKLPDSFAEDSAAAENAVRGTETANANRLRREEGLLKADDAREQGAEMAEQAKENEENRGRSENRPDRPDVPEPPGPQGPPGGT